MYLVICLVVWGEDLPPQHCHWIQWRGGAGAQARAIHPAKGITGRSYPDQPNRQQTTNNKNENASQKEQHTVNNNNISLSNPLLPQHPGQNLHLVQQPCIRKPLDSLRDRRLPNNRHITAPARPHMSINAVVRGGDLAIGKPRPMLMLDAAGQCLRAPRQRARRRFVPVEPLRRFGPE